MSSVIFQNIVRPISEVWHETLTAPVRMDVLKDYATCDYNRGRHQNKEVETE